MPGSTASALAPSHHTPGLYLFLLYTPPSSRCVQSSVLGACCLEFGGDVADHDPCGGQWFGGGSESELSAPAPSYTSPLDSMVNPLDSFGSALDQLASSFRGGMSGPCSLVPRMWCSGGCPSGMAFGATSHWSVMPWHAVRLHLCVLPCAWPDALACLATAQRSRGVWRQQARLTRVGEERRPEDCSR